MEYNRVISGDDEWPIIEADLKNEQIFSYSALITSGEKEIQLLIDIDLGGGFEGGYERTQIKAPIRLVDTSFRFAIHHEGFIDEIGKFFGMQDLTIGYPEFDKKVIVKSNDEERVRWTFADSGVRNVFAQLTSFQFGIHTHQKEDVKQTWLEFSIDSGLTDPDELREVYYVFKKVLNKLDS